MIERGIRENANLNLSELWNFCNKFACKVLVSDMKKNFLPQFDKFMINFLGVDGEIFAASLNSQISAIIKRSELEKLFWLDEIKRINEFSREQAIKELIKSRKIHEKITHIDSFIKGLYNEN